MEAIWNLWHGCHKLSEGCKNCYVHRGDEKYGRDINIIAKTKQLKKPIAKNKKGEYKYPGGTMFWTCFTSDFLLKDADEWRKEAWEIIKERQDCHFLFITKRIDRLQNNLPADWSDGYDNVTIGCTCENQAMVNYRIPIFKAIPIKHRILIHEPLLEEIDISEYLDDSIAEVIAGGESGIFARPCNYEWILKIRQSCIDKNIAFRFKQTGTHFIKAGKMYNINRSLQHKQAKKANINFVGNSIARSQNK